MSKAIILVTPEGQLLAFREASTAVLRQIEHGGEIHELPYEEELLKPTRVPNYGASAINFVFEDGSRGQAKRLNSDAEGA